MKWWKRTFGSEILLLAVAVGLVGGLAVGAALPEEWKAGGGRFEPGRTLRKPGAKSYCCAPAGAHHESRRTSCLRIQEVDYLVTRVQAASTPPPSLAVMTPSANTGSGLLTFDFCGVIRVVGTRVPIDTIIEAFEAGATAEEISADFSALRLEDVYAVLTYYLRHREEIGAYLEKRRLARDEVRRQNEARWDYGDTRRRLLARR